MQSTFQRFPLEKDNSFVHKRRVFIKTFTDPHSKRFVSACKLHHTLKVSYACIKLEIKFYFNVIAIVDRKSSSVGQFL